MKGHSEQGAAGNAAGDTGGKDGAADKGSNPYSHLGIEDADYQAYLEGKLTEDDLLGIANAASYYEAASGSGAGRFLYQNEAHKWAASIRAKYDPDYIKYDTYDYTHSGLYDPDRVEPMPGPPAFKVLTSLPKAGDEEAQAGGQVEDEIPKKPSTADAFNAVLRPKQRLQKDKIVNLIWDSLSKEQKQRYENGEDLDEIIKELNSWQRDKIETNFDKLEALDEQQYKDFTFLSHWVFEVCTMDERLTILKHLRKNGGIITNGDLMDMAWDAQGKQTRGGYFEMLTQNEYDTGSLDMMTGMLILAYRLAQEGITFEELNAQFIAEHRSEGAALRASIFASAVGAWVERKMFLSPGKIPGGLPQGTRGSSVGSQPLGKPLEVEGDFIDGIRISVGKVGGKIPVDEFKIIRQSSVKNPDANSITLGKFTGDETSYTKRAGADSSCFDLGSNWDTIMQKYGLTEDEMFHYFNKPALNDAIGKGKLIRFSHNPLDYEGSFLADEWDYIKSTLKLTDASLVFEGGFWYVK